MTWGHTEASAVCPRPVWGSENSGADSRPVPVPKRFKDSCRASILAAAESGLNKSEENVLGLWSFKRLSASESELKMRMSKGSVALESHR